MNRNTNNNTKNSNKNNNTKNNNNNNNNTNSASNRRNNANNHSTRPNKQNVKPILYTQPRGEYCLSRPAAQLLKIGNHNSNFIEKNLAYRCQTIEHQIISLRSMIQLSPEDYDQRYYFTQLMLDCLHRHHNILYQGILFGSTVNGLGFHDSDVDLRLRPLQEVEPGIFEPVDFDKDMIERVLKDIAYRTTRCCPSTGVFVPSTRCPVAKLTFFDTMVQGRPLESLKYDISLSSTNPFGTLNSRFLRFLCHLEPKFHLLATVLRYWSVVHGLIVSGYLSSYALVNMLIFFCQTVEPPLLPTVDHMRDLELELTKDVNERFNGGITQAEWQTLVCLKKEFYAPSTNTEPVSVLLLKFFEFCLNFPYSTHLLTIRPGKALTFPEYESSAQLHPGFKLKPYLNIQDPFDLAHNLTSGMSGPHFRLFMLTIRHSYERLFKELVENFKRPSIYTRSWGLLTIFRKLTEQEIKDG